MFLESSFKDKEGGKQNIVTTQTRRLRTFLLDTDVAFAQPHTKNGKSSLQFLVQRKWMLYIILFFPFLLTLLLVAVSLPSLSFLHKHS